MSNLAAEGMCTKGHVWQELQTLQERLGQPGQYLIPLRSAARSGTADKVPHWARVSAAPSSFPCFPRREGGKGQRMGTCMTPQRYKADLGHWTRMGHLQWLGFSLDSSLPFSPFSCCGIRLSPWYKGHGHRSLLGPQEREGTHHSHLDSPLKDPSRPAF